MRDLARDGRIFYRAALVALTLLFLFWSRGETARIAPVAVAMILLIAAGLTLTDRISCFVLPFMLLTLMLIFCYDSYADFVVYAPLAIPVIACLVVHVVRFPPKWQGCGKSLWPMVAVSLATTLGGVGVITAEEYFSPIALFYVFALGPGLLLFYLFLCGRELTSLDEADLLLDMCFFAVAATFVGLGMLWLDFFELGVMPDLRVSRHQCGNNLSTMLMLSMPALFAAGEKHPPMYLLGLSAFAAVVLSGSRGGLVMASAEVVLCLLYVAFGDVLVAPRRARVIKLLLVTLGLLAVGIFVFIKLAPADFISKYEVRRYLLERSFIDFAENPVTGVGLGSTRNFDLYPGKKGTLVWYHMFIPQIIGSMGLLGLFAWGWQLLSRARLAFSVRGTDGFWIMLCYAGLLLMSQVNPGEFCPFPYAVFAVYAVALTERRARTNPSVKT